MQNDEIEFCLEGEDQPIEKPELELDDLGLFDEDKNDDTKEIWDYIKNNNIEELKKILFIKEGISPKSNQVLSLKAIIAYLNQDKQAKDIMIKAIKNINYKNSKYFEFLIFIADRLKEFFDDKKSLLSLSSYIIQNVIYFKNDTTNYFYDVFKIIIESGFYVIQNSNLNKEEKKDIYIILFHFLNDFDYSNLNKDDYKIYLQDYTRILWVLRDEFPDVAKQLFSPLFDGIIYKNMQLDTDEEKIKKLTLFGIDKDVAKELVKVLKG